MIKYKTYKAGSVYGVTYEFLEAGDEIKRHAHIPNDEHNVICLSGEVLVILDDKILEVPEGTVCDFDSSKPHIVRAAKSNSRTLHIHIKGIPTGFIENYEDVIK